MCGIAGIICKNQPGFHVLTTISAMSNALRHRGPDGEGFLAINQKHLVSLSGKETPKFKSNTAAYLPSYAIESYIKHPNAVFAHRRLAIIDLEDTGHQPMCEIQGKTWITFNGEIYNYKELREELKNLGYRFASETDTEVVINAFLQWGENCVQRFNGMWAFCIYDSHTNRYFFSRDRLGVKPLYYINSVDYFAFASEQKAFVKAGLVKADTSDQSVLNYLLYNELEYQTSNFFNGIEELWPGTNITYCGNTHVFNTYPYYKPEEALSSKNEHLSDNELTKLIKHLLNQTIEWRMRSDVEVGTCLSGGIDSSVIAGIMATKTQKPVSCFTAVFRSGAANELPFAQKVAQKIQGNHFITEPNFNEFEKDLNELIYALDVPIWDTSTYAQFRVMKLAKDNHIKVVMDGQGADEHFGGYHHHYISLWKQLLNENGLSACIKEIKSASISIKQPLIFLMKELIKEQWQLFGYNKTGLLDITEQDLKTTAKSRRYSSNLNEALLSDFGSKRLKSFLRCEDRCGMWHSVESRTPFSDDYKLTELMFSFNGKRKIKNGISKYFLREASKDLIPHEIYTRYSKVGFETPMADWVKKMLPEILSSLKAASLPFLKKNAIEYGHFNEAQLKILFKLYMLVKWKELFAKEYQPINNS
jgi:asparagine synthase (glutamine-hydrolysing)